MKKTTIISTFALLLVTGACKKDSAFLDVPPKQVVTSDVAFSDPNLVLSILADLYNRVYDFSGLDNGWASFADFSESFPSENGSYYIVQRTGWDFGSWGTWDYKYVRDLNLFIERATAATKLTDAQKNQFIAEGRFLRAQYYFELVKRMGGVPLITKSLNYDFSGNVEALQIPRAKESEVYDFIISEAEAIKGLLPVNVSEKSRATPAAVLAMESRAALYAASIAKYGATTPQVSLPGGEVGIPASAATGYYTKALAAAKEIISGTAGNYSLYKQLPDLSDNFANLFLDKSSSESIWVEDFKANGGKTHGFTTNDQPFSISDEGLDAGRLNPSLNLVEAFEKLDNTYAPMATKDGSGNPIYYTDQLDMFAGRDARLAGTVLLPNGLFKGKRTEVYAGYQLGNGTVISSSDATITQDVPGLGKVQVVGKDGPVNGAEFRTQTGFYIRKYLDPTVGSGRRGRGSDVNFIRYRYAEVLLNAAEADAELGNYAEASSYINQVRLRAGLTTPLVLSAANYFDRIVHERRVELAFEGHTLFDMKRWRIADAVWDGNSMSVTDLVANIGKATKRNTQPFGLWPYKYYNPGNVNNGKWIFKETKPSPVTGSNRFLLGNYYSRIGDDVIAANPKIVKQPNQ
ncbi:RagB/SusD family nutrient uptake outer membrane protein [Mucilaginibacter rubeus]|uniref:RagB/SusD family nutrient uptake outer membrane protein n=1 Tax=Mucilaginibacter rubeus TaxID=2027860 RepID=A0AAE6JH21_9SPHI|nr:MULTISPECIES: RagB/SusD family nutrient uptake outer membrane protein [Mucilaginibacter]QEM05577.1 RagB/SusD family nutrient uptake outer membrane protein [Mucilaginibacter rubeus]QEM18165.1 RagB/SusD family nutrient uptake outer membrane protein [Mucilaginibacter gossypii]QTE45304.1 RagB/SusD family nutrient uptake outer membrane protein [Mucilaginibacter rubeus]QTE51900.1 RagB/SusD family nutrient uptake outer membrane protein [Mucilaginibacter rubeus]QTE56988.1 RagB/SusD family nutrient 